MIRKRLEELSFEALLQLGARNDLDVDPDIEREELIEALVDTITEIRRERDARTNAPGKIEQMKFVVRYDDVNPKIPGPSDDLTIPEEYSTTRIALMLRDPQWAYTYWDLAAGKRAEYEHSDRFDGLYLRVLQLEDDRDEELQISDSFEIPVTLADSCWYIHLPRQNAPYRIQLIGKNYHRRELLAVSNRVRSPRISLAANGDPLSERERRVLALCGLEFLDVNVPFDAGLDRIFRL